MEKSKKNPETTNPSSQSSLSDFNVCSVGQSKYGRNHPRQKMITNSIMDMVVKDLIPAHIVEKEGFRDLVQLLDPKYTIVSRQSIQYKLIPEKSEKIKQTLTRQLQSTPSCSVTLDIWTSRRMHGYFAVTVHFITQEWKMKSYLLCCRQLKGSHTGENIRLEYENIIEEYGIEEKVFKAVTDNGSNMVKAFKLTFEELKILNDNDHSDTESDQDDDEIGTDDLLDLPVDLEWALSRIKCFAHTLQLAVKDGIDSSKQVTVILAKVSKLVSHIKRSTSAMEKLEDKNAKGVVLKNDTRWNSHLNMVRRVLELDLEDVVDRRELMLTGES